MRASTKRVLIVGALLGIAAAVLVPALSHDYHGGQRPSCINNLRQICMAKEQWAKESHKTTNDAPTWDDLRGYLKPKPWKCPNGGTYTIGRIGELPICSIPKDTAYWREHHP